MSNAYAHFPPTHGTVHISTSHGALVINLFSKQCPISTRQFVQLAMWKLFEGCFVGLVVEPSNALKRIQFRGVKSAVARETPETRTSLGTFHLETHSRLRFSTRGLFGVDANSEWFFSLDPLPYLNHTCTIVGQVTSDTIFTLSRIADIGPMKDRQSDFLSRVTSAEVLVNPFLDVVPRLVLGGDDGDSGGNSNRPTAALRKRDRSVLSFGADEEEEEEEAEEAEEGHAEEDFGSRRTRRRAKRRKKKSRIREGKKGSSSSGDGSTDRSAGLTYSSLFAVGTESQESSGVDAQAQRLLEERNKIRKEKERVEGLKKTVRKQSIMAKTQTLGPPSSSSSPSFETPQVLDEPPATAPPPTTAPNPDEGESLPPPQPSSSDTIDARFSNLIDEGPRGARGGKLTGKKRPRVRRKSTLLEQQRERFKKRKVSRLKKTGKLDAETSSASAGFSLSDLRTKLGTHSLKARTRKSQVEDDDGFETIDPLMSMNSQQQQQQQKETSRQEEEGGGGTG